MRSKISALVNDLQDLCGVDDFRAYAEVSGILHTRRDTLRAYFLDANTRKQAFQENDLARFPRRDGDGA